MAVTYNRKIFPCVGQVVSVVGRGFPGVAVGAETVGGGFFNNKMGISKLIANNSLVSRLHNSSLNSELVVASSVLHFRGSLFLSSISASSIRQRLGVALVPVGGGKGSLMRTMVTKGS